MNGESEFIENFSKIKLIEADQQIIKCLQKLK